ncbi:hypothetical protein I316_06299 [Kwoniella heveanensis BCC8398]|uniref:Uncharacterized protein n=1 Tax=Kwoniella heveanensis BCC8398 TaxID=1296120 RepID=A0A1B9GMD6_9TREE|nr:hypothetical protein I316_06299 [Kwoniella heveanensis BCC8398]
MATKSNDQLDRSFVTADVDELLKRLTVDEKITLLAGKNGWDIKVTDGPNGARGGSFYHMSFDRMYAATFGLPTAIDSMVVGDFEAWMRDHDHLKIPIDHHLACSLDQFSREDAWSACRRQGNHTKEYTMLFVQDLSCGSERYIAKWFTGDKADPLIAGFLPQGAQLFTLYPTRLPLDCQAGFDRCRPESRGCGMPRCGDTNCGSTRGVFGQWHAKIHPRCWSTTLSSVGLCLSWAFWKMAETQREQSINLLKRIHRCTTASDNGDPEAATAFVARFIERVLKSITSASRAVTRHTSPSEPTQREENDNYTRAINDSLDDYLRTAEAPVMDGVIDDAYWRVGAWPQFGGLGFIRASLFSTAPSISGQGEFDL